MDNASKAIMIAGTILISVLVISIFMYVFTSIMKFNTDSKAQLQSNEATAFNRFFVEMYDLNYNASDGIQIKGYDAYNLIRKVEDVNNNPDAPVYIESTTPSANIFVSGDEYNETNILREFKYTYTLGDDGYISSISITN